MVELGCIDIVTEVSMLSSYLACPREDHLENALHAMGYLRLKHNSRLIFDPTYPYIETEFAEYIATLFAIFYVDDAYLASWDPEFLQYMLTHLVCLFEHIGLQMNMTKTQTMICTPDKIRTQLPTESYRRMRQGQVSASDWNSCNVECRQCGKVLKASSLSHHLADIHDIYQQAVVAEELLEDRPPVLYTVRAELQDQALPCPYPGCNGQLRNGWMMR